MLLRTLDTEVARYRAQVFSFNTRRTYSCHLAAYLKFCEQADLQPVPISERDLACYAAYLANRLSYSSIRQYLNIVRILHEEAGYTSPLANSWILSSLFKGIRRTLGDCTKPKLPITVDILKRLFLTIDFSSELDVCFWCACLIAFFSFLRKSNLFTDERNRHQGLTRGALSFLAEGVVIHIRASKTIQFNERLVTIPLARIPGSCLCPAQSALLLYKLCPGSKDAPFFRFRQAGRIQVMCYRLFLCKLKSKLSLIGLSPEDYAGHSFRRGGATLALSSNIPSELVKLQGDWASAAYLKYFDPGLKSKFTLATALATHVR